jgi:hypothetical protein
MSGVLRFLAGLLLLVAVIALVFDATRTLAGHRLVLSSLGEQWANIAPGTLSSARRAVERQVHPLLWQVAIAKLLLIPTWIFFGVLGIVAAYLGRQRRRANIFAN